MATAVPMTSSTYRLKPAPAPPNAPTRDRRKTIDDQRKALEEPESVNISTAPNPYQTEAYAGAKTFADSLADRSNASIKSAMQRERDVGAADLVDVRAGA